MKKSELIKIIELVVRKEVKKQVNEILIKENSIKSKPVIKSKPKPKTKVHRNYTSNQELNRVLNETVGLNDKSQEDEEWPTMGGGTFDSTRATELLGYGDSIRSQGASKEMRRNMAAAQTLKEKGVSTKDVPESVLNALTRDYSDLMKHDKMKSKK
jgi:hypothetical protein